MSVRLSRIVRAVEGRPLPSFPDLCGPDEISDALMAGREHERSAAQGKGEAWSSPISDEATRKLLRLAYCTSLLPDEGRFLRFRLVCSLPREGVRIVTFADRIPISTTRDLRRVAPVCDHPEHALSIVDEGNGMLSCDGIVHVGPLGAETAPSRARLIEDEESLRFGIEVKGPGHLIARDALDLVIELRGGHGRVLSPASLIPALITLRENFGKSCMETSIPDPRDPARRMYGGAEQTLSLLGATVIRNVIRRASDARHGGMIVVLPQGSPALHTALSVPFRVTDLDFRMQAGEYFLTCVRSETEMEAVKSLQACRAKLLSSVSALYGFTLVDGCVVMDEHLNTIGFGAEITVKDEAARLGMPFSSFKRREAFAYDDFMGFIGGTRHRSAARLCATVPGAIALVVSQDGELRVFCNDGMQAFGFGPMDTE